MQDSPTYEDQFGPIARRYQRLRRAILWPLLQFLGKPGKILVEMKWRLGDEIMALPIYSALREVYPKADIRVLSNYPELLAHCRSAKFVSETKMVPDRYILLRGAPRDKFRRTHYARQAGIPSPTKSPKLEGIGQASELLSKVANGPGPLVAVAPGASWSTKRWPASGWKALCNALVKEGYRLLELGQDGEGVGVGLDLCGKTSVLEVAEVISGIDLLVSSDSGLMHLALALDKPVVALFGPTDPGILVQDEPLLHVIDNGRDCKACWNVSMAMKEPGKCPLEIEECLETILMETVLHRIAELAPIE